VTRLFLDRIARHDGQIGAFADLDSEGALAAAATSAARWTRGAALSALDGIPLAIKSNIAVAGLPWTAGIGAYRERRATADAACVARLRAGGAVILGTTRMDEAALGAMGDNPWFGRTANPYDLDAIAGGSSAGSAAAVAAGFCVAALGTDTFGSVRIPAAWCGVFGVKPAFGAIGMDGILPLARGLDTLGFMARSIADCRVLSGFFGVTGQGSAGPIGLAGFDGGSDLLATRLREALAAGRIATVPTALEPDPFARLMKPALLVAEVEGAEFYGAILSDLSPNLRPLFEWGSTRTPTQVDTAHATLAAGRTAILENLAGIDLLITRAMTGPAPKRAAADDREAARFTLTASLCGLPALVLPIGVDPAGMPLAVQIMGRDLWPILDLAERLADVPPIPHW